MAPLPSVQQRLSRNVVPFNPTVDEDHNPTVCVACGRCSIGVGVGSFSGRDPKTKDPMYICQLCVTSVGDLTRMHRLNVYELKALDEAVKSQDEWFAQFGLPPAGMSTDAKAIAAGVESAGEFLATLSTTDLALFTEEQRNEFVLAIWRGCASGFTGLSVHDELDRRMIAKAAVEGFGRGVRNALSEAPF